MSIIYDDDTVLSAVPPPAVSPGASNSDSDHEDETPGPQRLASAAMLSHNEGLIASVVFNAVKQATAGIAGNIPCAELIDGVEVPPNRAPFVAGVKSLDALRTQTFSSEEERKAAVLPDLIAIRGAIQALPNDLFKWKLLSVVDRIDAFVQ